MTSRQRYLNRFQAGVKNWRWGFFSGNGPSVLFDPLALFCFSEKGGLALGEWKGELVLQWSPGDELGVLGARWGQESNLPTHHELAAMVSRLVSRSILFQEDIKGIFTEELVRTRQLWKKASTTFRPTNHDTISPLSNHVSLFKFTYISTLLPSFLPSFVQHQNNRELGWEKALIPHLYPPNAECWVKIALPKRPKSQVPSPRSQVPARPLLYFVRTGSKIGK